MGAEHRFKSYRRIKPTVDEIQHDKPDGKHEDGARKVLADDNEPRIDNDDAAEQHDDLQRIVHYGFSDA